MRDNVKKVLKTRGSISLANCPTLLGGYHFYRGCLSLLIGIFALNAVYATAHKTNVQSPDLSQQKQQLIAYLASVANDGKILSGQQVQNKRTDLYDPNTEYQHIFDITEKYPAVLGLDWFVSTQSTSNADSLRDAKVQMAIEHWTQGGIVTMSWHQQYPGHLDQAYSWVQRSTTQSEFDAIVSDGTALNNLWKSDVDLIAGYLQDLEDAGIPVIFRPYHEMNGAWFWWGNKSPSSYKLLWNNLYQRLTNYHGLNNLIWCWSPNKNVNTNYFPESSKVDLTGVDIYTSDRADSRYVSDHAKLQDLTSKPRVLAENGLLPTVSVLNQTNYSWFLPWHTGWCDNTFYGTPASNGPGNNPSVVLELYNHSMTITREEVNFQVNSQAGVMAIQNKSSDEYLWWENENLSSVPLTNQQLQDRSNHKFEIVNLNDGSKTLKHLASGQYFWFKNDTIKFIDLNSQQLQSWSSHKLVFENQNDDYFWIKHQSTGRYLYDKGNDGVVFLGTTAPNTSWNGPKWKTVPIGSNARLAASVAKASEPSEEEVSEQANTLNVYPNPSQGQLQINTRKQSVVKVQIRDMQGRMKLHKELLGSQQIEVGSLPSGLYLIQLQQDGLTQTRKLIIR